MTSYTYNSIIFKPYLVIFIHSLTNRNLKIMIKDAKYLVAYLMPLAAWVGLYYGGVSSLGAFYVAFVVLPLYELFSKGSSANEHLREEEERSNLLFFDVLLWLNLPILYGLVWFLFYQIQNGSISGYEIPLSILSVGIIAGTSGINVAHELGHRSTRFDQFIAKALLLPELYMHFFIEHNRGHHKNVATMEDPATSRLGESIYAFWFRSVTDSYKDAWKLEAERLRKIDVPTWSLRNEMLVFQLIQVAYMSAIVYFFSWKMLLVGIAVATVGFLLLECVNYIEHYGLMREKLPNGRYENVLPTHSWNSNHDLGRIFLYELTRHSDHHYKSTRKYQVLRHFDESPQLPAGYPGSIWLALVPPLWFKVMDKHIQKIEAAY
jgi:alkane 1-monooxygenase